MRLITTIGLGVVFGVILWLLIFGILFSVFRFVPFNTGFFSIVPDAKDPFAYLRFGALVGIAHGFIVSMAMLFAKRYESYFGGVLIALGLIAIVSSILEIYAFYFVYGVWRDDSFLGTIYNW